MTVAAILKHKGSEVVSVPPTERVTDLVGLLARKRIGAVPVCDAAGTLLGIVSERDVVRRLAEHGAAALEMTVAQLMTARPQTVERRTTVHEAMAIMTDGRFRHLPVVEEGRLVGIVSIGDVVKARITQQETEVDSLKAYVAGVG
jgi:CBS domain-containing protein